MACSSLIDLNKPLVPFLVGVTMIKLGIPLIAIIGGIGLSTIALHSYRLYKNSQLIEKLKYAPSLSEKFSCY